MHCRHTSTSINANDHFFSLSEKNKFNHFFFTQLKAQNCYSKWSRILNQVSQWTWSASATPLHIVTESGRAVDKCPLWFVFVSVSHAECSPCRCHEARARNLKGCRSFLNVSLEIWPPLSIEGTCSHTVQRLTQILGSTEWGGEIQSLISECVRGREKTKHAAFFLFGFCIFFQCSYLVYYHIWLSAPGCLAVCQLIRPPNGLIQAAWSAHGGGGVAVAAVSLHAFTLGIQAQVHQAVGAAGTCGAWAGQQAGGRALAPGVPRCHHGKLVGARACAVVQVGVGLEVLRLVVGVGRRQVGVVSGGSWHAEATDAGAGGVGRVGEGPGVVHAGVREARVSQRRERREGGPLLEEFSRRCGVRERNKRLERSTWNTWVKAAGAFPVQNFPPDSLNSQLRFLVIWLFMEMFAHGNELRHFFFGT